MAASVAVCVCVYNYHKRSHPTHVAMINCFDCSHATYLDVRQDMDACREKPEQACPIWEANRRRSLWHSTDLLHFQQLVKRNRTRNANEKTVETKKNKKPEPVAALRLSRTFARTVRVAFGLQLNGCCLEQRNSGLWQMHDSKIPLKKQAKLKKGN